MMELDLEAIEAIVLLNDCPIYKMGNADIICDGYQCRTGRILEDLIAEVRRLRAAVDSMGSPDHFVTWDEDGWQIEHSAQCRADGTLGTCEYGAAIRSVSVEPDPRQLGRWRIVEIDSEGLPSLERAP